MPRFENFATDNTDFHRYNTGISGLTKLNLDITHNNAGNRPLINQ